MKDTSPSDEHRSDETDELKARSDFIQLDVLARRVGGVKFLFQEHKHLYVQLGRQTGFLSDEEADQLAEELGLDRHVP